MKSVQRLGTTRHWADTVWVLLVAVLLPASLHGQTAGKGFPHPRDKGCGATGRAPNEGATAPHCIEGGNPETIAAQYDQPSDTLGSLTNAREIYDFTGRHAMPWYGRSIEVQEEGSGQAAGPARAAYALGLSIFKKHWLTTPTSGEIDGLSITARNNDDVAGILCNVGTIKGFAACSENVTYRFAADGSTSSAVRSMVAANSGNDLAGLASKGFATLCDASASKACDVAYYAGPNGGAFRYFLYNDGAGGGRPNFTVSATDGSIVTTGALALGSRATLPNNACLEWLSTAGTTRCTLVVNANDILSMSAPANIVRLSSLDFARALDINVAADPTLTSSTGRIVVGSTYNRPSKTPRSSRDVCEIGDEEADAHYIYRCVEKNHWRRAALDDF